MRFIVRRVTESELEAAQALVDREVRRGTVLPAVVDAERFLVAVEGDRVVGTVALKAWSNDVVELGTLVAAVDGQGIGTALAEAACDEASRQGYRTIVALTGLPGWFERAGFEVTRDAPWRKGRAVLGLVDPSMPELASAVAHKSATACGVCPHRAQCSQVLVARPLAAAVPRRVVA